MVSGNARGPVEDVEPVDVWHRLGSDRTAQLIDVRTHAELSFVGAPDLGSLGKQTIFVEWLSYPDQRINQHFTERCRAELTAAGADEGSTLFFICRSGARSASAAKAMGSEGFRACHNVAHGFEGPLDEAGHRGAKSGWKHAGLPWAQS